MILRVGHDRGFLGRDQRGPFATNRSPFHAAVGVVSPGGLGFLSDYGSWNQVFKAYVGDELSAAYEYAQALGVGPQGEYAPMFAIITAEFEVTESSQIYSLTNGPEFELAVALETEQFDLVAKTIRSATSDAEAILPRASAPLMITVLLEGALLPSTAYCEGYYTLKSSVGKLCLPADSLDDPNVLARRIRRGVAYHVGATRTGDTADAWLLEAMTVLVDPEFEEKPMVSWLTIRELNTILEGADKADDEERWRLARQEAGLAGASLFEERTMADLEKLLDAHGQRGWNSLLGNPGISETDRAFRSAWKTSGLAWME